MSGAPSAPPSRQAAFRAEWSAFRAGLADDAEPCLAHVLGLTPARGQFAAVLAFEPGDLVIELGGANAELLDHVATDGLAGWLSLDADPEVETRAWARVAAAGLRGGAWTADLDAGLPPALVAKAAALAPRRVRWISHEAAAWLDREPLLALLSACLDPALPSPSLDLAVRREGRYDADALARRFLLEIAPRNLLNPARMRRALAAMPRVRAYFAALSDVPGWTPDAVTDLARGAGFQVARREPELAWDQAVVVQIKR